MEAVASLRTASIASRKVGALSKRLRMRLMPNITGIENKSYKDYLTTVDELERLTGYDSLSDVPEAIQKVIEARKGSQ